MCMGLANVSNLLTRSLPCLSRACPVGKPCPHQGVLCNSGYTISVLRSYYMPNPAASKAYRCPSDSACLGGTRFGDASCAIGHLGHLCGRCADGFYRAQRRCLACADLNVDEHVDAGMGTAIAMSVVGVLAPILTLLYLQPPQRFRRLFDFVSKSALAYRISNALIVTAALT